MKKILLVGMILIILAFSSGTFAAAAEKNQNERKLRLELSFNPISTPFDATAMNRAEDYARSFENVLYYLMNEVLIRGSGWDYTQLMMCTFSSQPDTARGRVWAKSFRYNVGDVFPVTANRQFNLSKTGIPFRLGVNMSLSKKLSAEIGYHQSSAICLEMTENMDYVTIETLEELPVANTEYNLWEMYFLRYYESLSMTFKYRNLSLDIVLKYNLMHASRNVSFTPEVGVSFSFLRRTLRGEAQIFDYTEIFPGFFYPDEPLDDFRELRTTDKVGESGLSKLKTRFFAGMSGEIYLKRYMGITGTLRIFHKRLGETFIEESLLEEFLFEVNPSPFFASIGIVVFF